ncbi:MAG TPA: hypothetical protein HPP81_06250 [Deltaproteobacteria bacterium]|jgi:hypothetical protein|nr:hypothetical protein [Deltaproteobacteria bacterium]
MANELESPESYGASPQPQNLGREAAYWNQPLTWRRAAEICVNRCSAPTNLQGVQYGCLLPAGVSAVERNSIGDPAPCKVLCYNHSCEALLKMHPELQPKPASEETNQ